MAVHEFTIDVGEELTTFKVDRSARTVEGTIVPWNRTGRNSQGAFRFEPNSVFWSKPDRVKLLRDHDMAQPLGKALELRETQDGLYGRFQVARGPEGDRALEMAEDGILDGFSVGISVAADGWKPDKADRDVKLVTEARVVETSLTAIPAFDDARVAHVRMSAGADMSEPTTKENEMPEINTGGSDGATNEGAVTKFQEELDAQLGGIATTLGEKLTEVTEKQAEAIGTAFAGVYERLEQAATRAGGASAGVRLHSIKEPPVYRFDGDVKQASLVRDSWNWHHNGDYEARDRLHKFQDQQADLTKFQIGVDGDSPGVSHTVPDIIPPGYRPDLFVTQLMQGRPIVSQLSRGTISDATPFTVPRFVSMNSPGPGGSPGTGQAVNDHVEGVNPATSRLVVDSTVVQPAAISGIFELTREIVDSSNPAIDAIAMQSMRESWNQQTEQRAYTALNGAAPGSQAVDITGADLASDDGEIGKSVRHEILARYPFVRFAAPTGAVMSSGVTAHLARAEDGNGRPLFASVGAQNATGTGNAVAQGWSVDGLALTPAWAVTEEEDDDVLIVLNRQDVWSWESPTLMFRFEEKQGPAIVELALFGYYASHVLRPSGLFSVRLGDGS